MWPLGKEVPLWKYYLENFRKTTGNWKRPKTYGSCSHRHIYHIYLETDQTGVEATTWRSCWSSSNLLYLVLLQSKKCLLHLRPDCQILIWHLVMSEHWRTQWLRIKHWRLQWVRINCCKHPFQGTLCGSMALPGSSMPEGDLLGSVCQTPKS